MEVEYAFNRTTVECKGGMTLSVTESLPPFNRTTVECKVKILYRQRFPRKPFNRTTVECKVCRSAWPIHEPAGF